VTGEREPRTNSRRKLLVPAAAAGILLAACAPESITETGHDVGNLYNIVLVMATVVFVAVEVAIVYNAIRYRRRRDDDGVLPEQIHGNRNVEILWTAIPAVIIMALFVMSMVVLVKVNHEETAPLTVKVTGFQWQWRFDYFSGPDDQHLKPAGVTIAAKSQVEPPTLVLPVGERIHFILVSGDGFNDVIHSFYVPEFLFKRDVIPGRTNTFDIPSIDTNKIGMYHGQCAELCGDFHNEMTFELQTMAQTDFDSWLKQQAEEQRKAGGCVPTGTALQITAQNTSFDKNCLAAPAGQPFTIEFDNQDPSVPHNVAIYDSPEATKLLGGATGPTDVVTGVAKTTYRVKPLQAGKFFFRCDVHPTAMFGTFVVK
jgi:cytochrome c oxidase subunit II